MQQDYLASSTEPVCSRPVDAMTNLSPAAQAVLDALCMDELNGPQQLMARAHAAVALWAAADQVKYEFPLSPEYTEWDSGHDAGIYRTLNKFLAIAAELEAHQ